MKTNRLRAVDLFCGAGGTSTGLVQSCRSRGLKLNLLAVNHWKVAVETHAANHPEANHLCETLDSIDPRKAMPGRLDLLIASPECTHHSIARGGLPCSDQSRASAWHVVRWTEALRPKAILVENVREFQTWGPLGTNGLPLKRRRGDTFRAWIAAVRSLGYSVGFAVLNAANYGDPTTRQRLFVVALRGNHEIPMPNQTHSKEGGTSLFGNLQRWQPARSIIDWTMKGESIFNRKRPLSENTMKRIKEGAKKFWGSAAEPFLLQLTHGGRTMSTALPLPTVTGARRGEIGVVQPFILPPEGIHRGNTARSIDEPLQTITAGRGGGHVVEPFLVSLRGTAVNQMNGARPVSQPAPPVTAGGNHIGLCEPFLVPFYGTGVADSINEPLASVTTKDRFGLVEGQVADILFRMLQPHELAAAMSFPKSYRFSGTREQQVKQIGNAVPVNQADALCGAILDRILA